jgi:anti-sigma regulatory factor (Ser/Thr protein kinase)
VDNGRADPDLTLATPADAAHTVRIRHRLRDWLTEQRLPHDLIADILLAVTEAVTNVVDHAYRATCPGQVALSVRRTAGQLVTTISDQGTWRPPLADPGNRGRGLRLVRALAQHVHIDTQRGGTTVTAVFTLPAATEG